MIKFMDVFMKKFINTYMNKFTDVSMKKVHGCVQEQGDI